MPGHPCDVAARPGEAGDQLIESSGRPRKNDGDRRCGMLGSEHRCRRRWDEDINLEPDQLGHKIGEPFDLPLRPAVLDRNVLTLHPAEFTQPLPKGIEEVPVHRSRAAPYKAYARNLPRGCASGASGAQRRPSASVMMILIGLRFMVISLSCRMLPTLPGGPLLSPPVLRKHPNNLLSDKNVARSNIVDIAPKFG